MVNLYIHMKLILYNVIRSLSQLYKVMLVKKLPHKIIKKMAHSIFCHKRTNIYIFLLKFKKHIELHSILGWVLSFFFSQIYFQITWKHYNNIDKYIGLFLKPLQITKGILIHYKNCFKLCIRNISIFIVYILNINIFIKIVQVTFI